MDERVEKVLKEANQALDDADFLLAGERTQATVNRAYYCVFHCMQAMLQMENIQAKTHQGTLRKFNELFIKTEKLPTESAKMITNLSVLRNIADYDYQAVPSLEEAQEAVNDAAEFLALIENYFSTE
ncbi:MAG: HEPN domain-containing protein [Bacteroidota bacterium]